MNKSLQKMVSLIGRLWQRIPTRHRPKVIVWLVTLAVSQLIRLIWGTGVWIALLLMVSAFGAILASFGVREARYADSMLGKVWDYLKGSILFALLPALWPALQAFIKGDPISGVIQLAMIGLVVAVVFEQFNKLPRAMSKLMYQRRR
jgi:hypothetical protein